MAPTIRSSSSGLYNGYGSTFSVTLPATISAGDLLVVFVACWQGTDTGNVDSTLTGFTHLTNSGIWAYQYHNGEIFYKTASGSEDGTTVTFDPNGTSVAGAWVAVAIQNASTSAPNYGSWYTGDSTYDDSTPDSPTCSTSGINDPIVFRMLGYSGNNGASVPTGTTLVATNQYDADIGIAVATDNDGTAQAITNGWSVTSPERLGAVTIAIGTGSVDATPTPGFVATPASVHGPTVGIGAAAGMVPTPAAVPAVAGYTTTADVGPLSLIQTPAHVGVPILSTTNFLDLDQLGLVATPASVLVPTLQGAETRLYAPTVGTPVEVLLPPFTIDPTWVGTTVNTPLAVFMQAGIGGTADIGPVTLVGTPVAVLLAGAPVRVDVTHVGTVIATPVAVLSPVAERADSFPQPLAGGYVLGGAIAISSIISGWPDNKFITAATLDVVTRVIRWVDIYDSDGVTMWWEQAPVTAGKVSVSMERSDRRTMNVTLENISGEFDSYPGGFWYDKILRVYWGYQHSDGSTWSTSLGTYRIDTIVQPRFPHVVELTCRDLSSKLSSQSFSATEVYAVNTPIEVIVQQVASNGGITLYDLPGTGVSAAKEYVFEPGTDRWQAITDVCEAHNYLAYFTPEGELTMQPYPDPNTIPIKWEFKTGVDGNLADYKKQTNPNKLYNHIVVVGEDAEGVPVFGEAENNEPTSPTRIAAIGRRTAPPVRNSLITTTGAATLMAERLLVGAAQEQFELPIQSLVLPWLDAGDVVQFTDPDPSPGDPNRYILMSYEIDMALGPMSAVLSRLTTVG